MFFGFEEFSKQEEFSYKRPEAHNMGGLVCTNIDILGEIYKIIRAGGWGRWGEWVELDGGCGRDESHLYLIVNWLILFRLQLRLGGRSGSLNA